MVHPVERRGYMAGTNKSGRKAKPATIVEKRRRSGIKDSPSKGIPRAPDNLSEDEKTEWKRVSRLLRDAGLLESLDKTLLTAYCITYSRWLKAENKIKRHGMLVKSPNGYPMQSPYLAIANKAMEQMLKILGELGMTPASRSRIPKQEKERKRNRTVAMGAIDPRDLLGVKN